MAQCSIQIQCSCLPTHPDRFYWYRYSWLLYHLSILFEAVHHGFKPAWFAATNNNCGPCNIKPCFFESEINLYVLLFVFIILCDFLHYCISDKPTLTYRTTTGDTYYEGQPLTVSCSVPEIPTDALFYLLTMQIGQGYVECRLSRGSWAATVVRKSTGVQHENITDNDCNLAANENTLTVALTITQELIGVNITCLQSVQIHYADSSLILQQVKCKSAFILLLQHCISLICFWSVDMMSCYAN